MLVTPFKALPWLKLCVAALAEAEFAFILGCGNPPKPKPPFCGERATRTNGICSPSGDNRITVN